MNIQGQAALVTGGASGLGEATARELARLGAKVAVLDVNLALAEKVARTSTASRSSATSPTPKAWPRPLPRPRRRTARRAS
jgi:NAD(P)-dependent dehydrogenase (short-subunit alcohol dehydrogenase family)